ncbi:hypothetical protein RHGRI_015455 [Rhododendron griersonianum]|uniref:Uncharacterized protein n=1 Tax=Rhododendron griersonianum TaxID=479676 RepID=A0AAV6KDX6_9ERIC|nr:hypothetical protein RHGRI_015455 [Rhododendron griersonianum]
MEIQIHPTEMSHGENGSDEEALQHLTLTIDQKIDKGVQKTESFFSSASIYKVPEYLRTLKESAYTPCLVAIGPLHREDKHLQTPLQHVKMSYTNYLLSRLTTGMEDQMELAQTKFTVLQECLAELKTLVDDAKKCYAEEVTLDEEMMLVDGCFILELFYGCRTKTYPVLVKEEASSASMADLQAKGGGVSQAAGKGVEDDDVGCFFQYLANERRGVEARMTLKMLNQQWRILWMWAIFHRLWRTLWRWAGCLWLS